MQSLPRQQPAQVALIEVAEQQKEFLVEWGDQLVEGRAELKSLAERRLYKLNDSRWLYLSCQRLRMFLRLVRSLELNEQHGAVRRCSRKFETLASS